MFVQYNARVNTVYSSRWHFDAGYEAIATFTAAANSFLVTMKGDGSSESVATLADIEEVVGNHVDNMSKIELWKAGLRTRFL